MSSALPPRIDVPDVAGPLEKSPPRPWLSLPGTRPVPPAGGGASP